MQRGLMNKTHIILTALFVSSLACPVMAQGLTAAECAQIQVAYGVSPSECQAAPAATEIAVQPVVSITEPTQDMRQNNVFFTKTGASLDAVGLLQLQRLADLLNAPSMQTICLKLVGHSDSSGGGVVNMEMGAKRATVVQNRLSVLLLNPRRVEAVQSMGEEAPLAGLPSTSQWQRRVTIWARECRSY